MRENVLSIEALSVGFGGRLAVADITLDLAGDESLLVCGGGSSGKSTLLQSAAGIIRRLVRPKTYSGAVRLFAECIDQIPQHDLFGRIGVVLQNLDDQLWDVEVEDAIAFRLENRGTPREVIRSRLRALFDQLGIGRLSGRRVLELSGGERRMVMLAAAFASKPSMLVLDEPTTGLDPGARDVLARALVGLRPSTPMIIADQDAASLAPVVDRACLLADGRVLACGPYGQLLLDSQLWLKAGVLPPGQPSQRRATDTSGDPILEVCRMRTTLLRNTGEPVLRDMSFRLCAGEVLGLVGQNGAGKTTLVQAILGLASVKGGSIAISGDRVDDWTPARRARRIGYLPQNMRRVLFNATVIDEVIFAMTRNTRDLGDAAIRERAAKRLEPYGLGHLADESPFALSSRQQAFLGLACLEASECTLAVLDEPLLARDLVGRRMLDSFLTSWTGAGRGIIVISHDLDLIEAVSDRLIVLADGIVAFDGPVQAAWHSPAFGALGWPAPVRS